MYKTDFPFFSAHPEITYLDSAATTQKPYGVIERVAQFYVTECAPVGRSLYQTGIAATANVEVVRNQLAQFLDAPSGGHIIFTHGATDALNLLASGLATQLEEGDEIILSEAEHHSNLVPWQKVAETRGARLLFIKTHENGEIDLVQLGESLSQKTKIVALSLVSNVFGTILPVEEINNLLDRQGSRPYVILDASQAAAHFPLSVQTLQCDALVVAGHKMYGPNGVGVLWGRGPLLERLAPYRLGGGMIDRVSLPESSLAPLPARLEAGSPNTEGILGLGAAVHYLTQIGMEQVKAHITNLHATLLESVRGIPGIQQVGEPDPSSGILSMTHESIHPHDIAQFLADRQICVRAGHQCAQPLHTARNIPGSLRVSLGLYNTEEDIARFASVLREVVAFFTND